MTGLVLAIVMPNAGGAWDNAEKYIEGGVYGGRGSPEHETVVIGDAMGGPLKGTSGSSINILIKPISMVSIMFVRLVVAVRLL